MITKSLLAAIISVSLASYDVFAVVLDSSSGAVLIQAEEPQDFEDWYEPDEAYPEDGRQQAPNEDQIVPEGGDNQPRVAPDEDTRPRES